MVFTDLQDNINYQVATACLANKIIIVFSGFRSTKSQKKGLYVTENILQFPVTAPGTTSEAKLKINNYSPGDTPYSVSRYGIAALKHFQKEPSVSLVLWSIHVLHISRSTFCLPTTNVQGSCHIYYSQIQLDLQQRNSQSLCMGEAKSITE